MPSDGKSPTPVSISTTKTTKPSEMEITMKRRGVQLSPACARRKESGTRLDAFWRASNCFRLPSTCSRRDFRPARGARCCCIGSLRVTLAIRRSAFRSPESNG
jgi:hypothetical protein